MSSGDVELVRSVFDAFNRRDWEAWESLHDRDVEWVDPEDVPGGGVDRGVAGIRRFLDELLSIGNDWRAEVDSLEAVGPGRVLMGGRSVLTGRTSGMHMEDALFQLFEIEGGRVRRVLTFRSEDDAKRAAGLSD
jgi:ketosteroid isomerase-like protein